MADNKEKTNSVKLQSTGQAACCVEKHTQRSEEQKKALMNRLKRIEGQLRGIQKMVDNDAYCNDILVQSSAANAALNAFNRELLTAHIRTCVAGELREGNDDVIEELATTLQRLMR